MKESDAAIFDRFMEEFVRLGKSAEDARIPGISPRQLRRYAGGYRPARLNPSSLEAMSSFLSGHVRRPGSGPNLASPGRSDIGATLDEIEANGGVSEIERYYLEELRKISDADASFEMKVLARDSLASSITRLGNIIADRAAEARARAIEKAESASESRARAIERAETSAAARADTVREITSGRTDAVERMTEEEVMEVIRRRQPPDTERASGE